MIKIRDLSARRERQRKSALERDLDAALAKIEVLEDMPLVDIERRIHHHRNVGGSARADQ